MMDLAPSNQASSEGPALIPIVGNNNERGVNQYYQAKYSLFKIQRIYATSICKTRVYTQLCRRKPAYTKQTYNLFYLSDVDYKSVYLSEINSNQTSKTEQKTVTHKNTRYKVETQCG